MEIFEMELDKPLDGVSNDGHPTRPFSDDIDVVDALDSDRSGSSMSPSPLHHHHHHHHNQQRQQQQPAPALHNLGKRHQHSHPKWDPAFPSPSSSSGSSTSSSTASSVSSISPTSMWEDGSPGQRKATTAAVHAGAPRVRPQAPTISASPFGSGRAGEGAPRPVKQPLPTTATATTNGSMEHTEHKQQAKRAEEGPPAIMEHGSGVRTGMEEGFTSEETKQANNGSTAAGGSGAGGTNNKYNQMKAKYLRSLNFNEQEVQKRVLNGRHRSISLPVARPNLGPPPSQVLIQQQQSQMGASPPSSSSSSCSSSSSSPLQSPSDSPYPTAIPIPTRRGSQAQAVPPGGLGLSDFSLAPEPGVKLEASSFVPPHELVKRDTFSVWQYEKKKNAAYKAL